MNGIGITEWRDLGVSSSYPLDRMTDPSNIFIDAAFVQFDSFIPSLTRLTVEADGVTFYFVFDSGVFGYKLSADNCIEGHVITLSKGERYYGRLVCGPGIVALLNNYKGAHLKVDTKFLAITVRSIPSGSGVFSIQGITNSVTILPDHNQKLDITDNTVTWNTVSKPSRTLQVQLRADKFYALTSAKRLVEIDPVNGLITVLCTLPRAYEHLVPAGDKLIVADNTALYNITSSATTTIFDVTTALTDTSARIKGLAYYAGNILTTVTSAAGSKLLHINETTFALETTTDLPAVPGKALTVIDGQALYNSAGPYDITAEKTVSDFLYKGTTLQGMFTVEEDHFQAPLCGLLTLDTVLYGLTTSATATKLFTINPLTYTGTLIKEHNYAPELGTFTAMSPGGNILLSLSSIIPLKTINSIAPIKNSIQILGSNLIQVTQTSSDTLTISLAVDPERTTITRSKKYQ